MKGNKYCDELDMKIKDLSRNIASLYEKVCANEKNPLVRDQKPVTKK